MREEEEVDWDAELKGIICEELLEEVVEDDVEETVEEEGCDERNMAKESLSIEAPNRAE